MLLIMNYFNSLFFAAGMNRRTRNSPAHRTAKQIPMPYATFVNPFEAKSNPSGAYRMYVIETADMNVAGIAAIRLDFVLTYWHRYDAPAHNAIIASVWFDHEKYLQITE